MCLTNCRVKAGAIAAAGDPQLSLDSLLEIEGLIVIIVFEAIFELPSPDLRNNHFFCRLLLTSHQFSLIFGCHWIYVFRLCGESNAFVISRLQADHSIDRSGWFVQVLVGTNGPKYLYLGFWSRNNWRSASPLGRPAGGAGGPDTQCIFNLHIVGAYQTTARPPARLDAALCHPEGLR
jgi:hypothetical protein